MLANLSRSADDTSTNLSCIQGDCLHLSFNLSGAESNMIDHLYFTSAGVDFQKEVVYNAETAAWEVELTHDETVQFNAGRYTWDLTAMLTNGCVLTLLYNKSFVVNQKTNELTY